jgi:hypothetical protein
MERIATIRRRLIELLEQEAWTSLDLSRELSIQEREVFSHLEHVKKTLGGQKLVVRPYRCLSCDYVFRKRDRLDRPGRCPKCRQSHIGLAEFSLSR